MFKLKKQTILLFISTSLLNTLSAGHSQSTANKQYSYKKQSSSNSINENNTTEEILKQFVKKALCNTLTYENMLELIEYIKTNRHPNPKAFIALIILTQDLKSIDTKSAYELRDALKKGINYFKNSRSDITQELDARLTDAIEKLTKIIFYHIEG